MKTHDEQLLRVLLKDTRNPHRLALTMGKSVSEIRTFMRETEMDYLPGWGRVGIQKDVLSRRRVNSEYWPREDMMRIKAHQDLHDAGNVSLCHGRDGEFIILYAQHNNPPIKGRRPYFKDMN